MGKYVNAKLPHGKAYENPDDYAKAVLTAARDALNTHRNDIRNSYLNGVRNARLDRMEKLLGAWYTLFRGVAPQYARIMLELKRRRAGRR